MSLKELNAEVEKLASPEKAKAYARFFKTGKGKYGEGDIFIGLTGPLMRSLGKKYKELSLREVVKMLHSRIHEKRFIALVVLMHQYKKADAFYRRKIVNIYLKNIRGYINNWDLVDVSASQIVGAYLLDKPRDVLYQLAFSKNLWEKRVSIISTFAFIRNNEFSDSLKIAKILLDDKHDLIHKAVGWTLREVGKKDVSLLEKFIRTNYSRMSRTALRYAIEKFAEEKRKRYLLGNF